VVLGSWEENTIELCFSIQQPSWRAPTFCISTFQGCPSIHMI
jgi:hypothetical protein